MFLWKTVSELLIIAPSGGSSLLDGIDILNYYCCLIGGINIGFVS